MTNTEKLKSLSSIEIENILKEDGRTTIEYFQDWISDLDKEEDELLAVYHLQQAIQVFQKIQITRCENCKHWDDKPFQNSGHMCDCIGTCTHENGFCLWFKAKGSKGKEDDIVYD